MSDASADPREGRADLFIALQCPSCGAAIELPAYHRMARCTFCLSVHLVQRDPKWLVTHIPDVLDSREAVRASVLRHLRDERYTQLYEEKVGPLLQDAASLELGAIGPGAQDGLIALAEAAVEREADAWAAAVAPRVKIGSWIRFTSPYWHRTGTLYQVAFGRDQAGTKRMDMAVTTLEISESASSAPLPPMGRLSYLKALLPFPPASNGAVAGFATEFGTEVLDRRAEAFARRTSDLAITPIAARTRWVPEVTALVHRPWHLVDATLDDRARALLIDGGSGRVEGAAPPIKVPGPLSDLSHERPSLVPSRCPDCGWDLPYAPECSALLCLGCYRLISVDAGRCVALPYRRESPREGCWSVPFWSLPLRIRRADGTVVTDLAHLTDGIDGAYDQIGNAAPVNDELFVPAFRTRLGKRSVRLYRQLFPLLRGTGRDLAPDRYTPGDPPTSPIPITLPAAEVLPFAQVFLALAFSTRDLARADIARVRQGFLDAHLEGTPHPVFLNIPVSVIAPVQQILGRPRPPAVAALEGNDGTSRR